MEEIWKDIIGYEGFYQVSNLGEVRSLDRIITYSNGRIAKFFGKVLNPIYDKDGYRQVSLCKNGKQKEFRLHRLVANSFVPNIDGKKVINHKNCIKDDNVYTNLEWCTQRENDDHAKQNGRLRGNKGEAHPFFGKSRKDFPLKRIILDNSTGIFYDTLSEAAFAKNIPFSTLSKKMSGWHKNNTSLIYV